MQSGATLESHPIFVCGIEMVESLQIFLVGLLNVGIGEEVDGHTGCATVGATAYACGGDEMGVGSESLAREDVIARLHHSGIIYVDI